MLGGFGSPDPDPGSFSQLPAPIPAARAPAALGGDRVLSSPPQEQSQLQLILTRGEMQGAAPAPFQPYVPQFPHCKGSTDASPAGMPGCMGHPSLRHPSFRGELSSHTWQQLSRIDRSAGSLMSPPAATAGFNLGG